MGRIAYKIVEGKRCNSCGRTQRFAKDRRCVFCVNWDTHERGDWSLILALGQDHRRRTSARLRRHERRSLEGTITAEQSRWLLTLQNGCCAYCDERIALELDHVLPVALGGSNWWWNMQWLCKSHNQLKSASHERDFLVSSGLSHNHVTAQVLIRAALGLAQL